MTKDAVAWINKHDLYRVSICQPTPEGDEYVAPGQRLTNVTLSSARHCFYGDTPLFTEAPKRPWVPLTDEEKDSLLLPFGSYWVIDAIEAKLKEKNGV